MVKKTLKIGDRIIGAEAPPYVIAEIGVNHNGDMKLAEKMVSEAAGAGADGIKFQNFKPESLILEGVSKAPYQKETTSSEETQMQMLSRLTMRAGELAELKACCESYGSDFLCTPFDQPSLVELEEMKPVAYKVASTDTTNLPFLREMAATGRPILFSTGMTYMSELEMVVREIRRYHDQIVVLHCTANYPIENDEADLACMPVLASALDTLVGYSDHTVGIGASPYAVMFDACVIEKHFCLDRNMEGPDQRCSLEPDELKQLVEEVHRAWEFRGSDLKMPTVSELETRKSLQKCLVAAGPIAAGEAFSNENLTAKRTGGDGISPLYIDRIVGREAPCDFAKDDIISL